MNKNGSIDALWFGMTIKFTIENDEGDETEIELPSKKEVCSRCDGHGTHLTPSIGEHAYTSEEFHESFDEEEAQEYFKRGGRYDVTCHECGGKNVVDVVDESRCTTEEQKAHLKAYYRKLRADEDYEAERAHEIRMGY